MRIALLDTPPQPHRQWKPEARFRLREIKQNILLAV
jgi:hypothetical protein